MPFDIPKLSAPTATETRIIEWHFPGGMRIIMSPRPNNTIEPLEYNSPPWYEYYIYASGDYGRNWSEVTNSKDHIPFTILPLDTGVDRIIDAIYCGGTKVIARALDTSPETSPPSSYLRLESNDLGRNWSMKNEIDLENTGTANSFIFNTQHNACYAGDGEVFTLRPKDVSHPDSEKLNANVWKSTDYGDQEWEKVGEVVGWNCRGITYIGKDSIFGRKMFVCIATWNGTTGRMDYGGPVHAPVVLRSDDNGVSWKKMQMLSTANHTPHFFDGWTNYSKFTYLGDGDILLQTDMNGIVHQADSVIWKSTDYGRTWTETFRFPTTPTIPTTAGDDPSVLHQYSKGIWYIGRTPTKTYFVPTQYQQRVYALVDGVNAGGEGYVDEYLSDDGGDTWEFVVTLPRILNTTDDPYDTQIWFPILGYIAEDNGAIPGLYD